MSAELWAMGDDDILIELMAASICHSDIHTELGHWGKQIYPQVPGHEIVGVVREAGKNVKTLKSAIELVWAGIS
nr:alcohol dehydrogenase catalytic domain-containing protein [uncultured Campylobacter sp.]